jgi:hypothetical protein
LIQQGYIQGEDIMEGQETKRVLLDVAYSDMGSTFRRSMNTVSIGCGYLSGALKRNDYDGAINIANRTCNVWLEAHCAYHAMHASLDARVLSLPASRELLIEKQRELLMLLEAMINEQRSVGLCAAATPLRLRLLDILPA